MKDSDQHNVSDECMVIIWAGRGEPTYCHSFLQKWEMNY